MPTSFPQVTWQDPSTLLRPFIFSLVSWTCIWIPLSPTSCKSPKTNLDLRSGGAIFTATYKKKVTRKLSRFHIRLLTFSFHFGKPEKPSCSWFSGLVDVSMTPKINYSWVRAHQNISKSLRTDINLFFNMLCVGSRIFRKDARQENIESHFISSQETWIWDQSLPERMNWAFGSLQSMEFKEFQVFVLN